MLVRKCEASDRDTMVEIINDAAEVYRGVIPPDRWRDPYMPLDELTGEIEDGVEFWGVEQGGELLGIMGIQDRGDVTLIRHAYVRTRAQGRGVGTKLLRHLEGLTEKPILIGTWAAATWAIVFYERNGYVCVPVEKKERLLRTYWSIPERQVETSVVLARRGAFPHPACRGRQAAPPDAWRGGNY